jgi:hypothetical protein
VCLALGRAPFVEIEGHVKQKRRATALPATAHRSNSGRTADQTLTEEGNLVLGVRLDDPLDDPAGEGQAATVPAGLVDEFCASAGRCGAELPPAQSSAEWSEDDLVMLRSGSIWGSRIFRSQHATGPSGHAADGVRCGRPDMPLSGAS